MPEEAGPPEDERRRPSTAVKVVVTGPYAVGKTTLVRTLSEIDVVTTERRVPLGASTDARSTTVAMDFGRMTIDADLQLCLFGTSGQPRLDFLWDIFSDGVLGVIVLLDHTRPDSYLEAAETVAHLQERGDVPHVVGVNRIRHGEEERARRMARHQMRLDEDLRVLTTDVRQRSSAKGLLLELFHAARDLDLDLEQAQEHEHTW